MAEALAQGADVFLTGEMRHHDALAAAAKGLTVIATLHSNRCVVCSCQHPDQTSPGRISPCLHSGFRYRLGGAGTGASASSLFGHTPEHLWPKSAS